MYRAIVGALQQIVRIECRLTLVEKGLCLTVFFRKGKGGGGETPHKSRSNGTSAVSPNVSWLTGGNSEPEGASHPACTCGCR